MNSRDQMLSLVLIGAVVLGVAGAGGYFFVWQPLQKQRAAAATLNDEILDLQKQVGAQRQTAARLAQARAQSLPADEALARREYVVALERMIEAAGAPKGYTISPKAVDNSARVVPEISKGKPVYTKVAFEVVLKKVDMWMVKDFLEQYYRLGLLHQITSITLKKDDDGANAKKAAVRNDLTLTFTTEAILVDGAQNRRTLLPIPTGFAGLGGGALHAALGATPEAGRNVRVPVTTPTLAVPARDYSLIVRKDPFSGPLIDPPASPFKLDKLADVKVRTDEAADPVKVKLTGDGAAGARITAIASGTLFAEGALKVDPKTYAIELPKTSAYEGTATINVIATSADGTRTEKGSFKVTVADPLPPPPVDKGEDLSPVILLVGVSVDSDGKAWARVLDHANRLRYQVEATPKGVKVTKEYVVATGRPWQTDTAHNKLGEGLIQLDAWSKQTRTFRVVAVTMDGLIVADIAPPSTAKGPPPRPGKQGPGAPLAALGGNLAVVAPQPKYYRWPVGQPLSGLKALLPSEIRDVLKTAEATGPVFDIASK
jgi:hypothetical protein